MAFEILNNDKSFLLEEHISKFEKLYTSDTIIIPEHWKDYYFTEDQIKKGEVSEWKLVKKFLLCDTKTAMECFFDCELPRSVQQSCQILLRNAREKERFTFKDKPFEKKYFEDFGRYDVLSAPFYIQQKFKDIDTILRINFNKKFFFLFEKKVTRPYQIGSIGCYYFTLRDKNIEYYSETEDYIISDIAKVNEKRFFDHFMQNGYRYNSVRRLDEIARSIKDGNYSPDPDIYALGGGAIAILQSLYPQLPLIHFEHAEWDNSKIIIVEEKGNAIYKSNRVDYSYYLTHCFFQNISFNNVGYLCNREEFLQHKTKLLIKFSYQTDDIKLSLNEIIDILNQ